jgi:hypothetical protein
MQDRELTGLEWRLLLWISLHDGMSLVKGSGPGCYASNLTLFGEVGCEYSAGCRALSNLVRRGHLVREQVGRSTRYRVVFGEPDNLQAGNTSSSGKVAASQHERPEYVAEPSGQMLESAGETSSDYSSLSEGLDSAEAEEIDSENLRDAQSASRHDESIPSSGSNPLLGKNPAEAGLGRREPVSIVALLPKRFNELASEAQLSAFERAFTDSGRQPDAIEPTERQELASLLFAIADARAGEQVGYIAQRLFEELAA